MSAQLLPNFIIGAFWYFIFWEAITFLFAWLWVIKNFPTNPYEGTYHFGYVLAAVIGGISGLMWLNLFNHSFSQVTPVNAVYVFAALLVATSIMGGSIEVICRYGNCLEKKSEASPRKS